MTYRSTREGVVLEGGSLRDSTRVSVIIPTRNRSALLRDALVSVRALEDVDVTCEILVVNDGSSDDTDTVAAEFGARVIHASPPDAPRGRGTAAARNVGLREATGEYVTFLDDDDVWSPEHLRPHLAMLKANPKLVTVVGQVVNTDQDRVPVFGPWPPELPADWDTLRLLFCYTVQIAAFVSRISVRDQVGYFDEADPEAYDWDWCFRVVLHGEAAFVPVPSVLFRQREAHAF
jgi:glycosyltransferase involved in cell wall biosynthesis